MYNFSSKNANYGTLSISRFGGVDFATSPLNMSLNRSPDSVNMMPCGNGSVECRHGYEEYLKFNGRINGIYTLSLDSGDRILVHHGTTISEVQMDGTVKELYTNANDSKSCSVQMDNKVYIFDGLRALIYGELDVYGDDGNIVGSVFEIRKLEDEAYSPTIYIGKELSYYDGDDLVSSGSGGTAYENVNLLSDKRTETFCVHSVPSDTWSLVKIFLSVAPISVGSVKIEQLTALGDWVLVDLDGLAEFDYEAGVITVEKEKYDFAVTSVSGMDNYRITYTVKNLGDVTAKSRHFTESDVIGNGVYLPAETVYTEFTDYYIEDIVGSDIFSFSGANEVKVPIRRVFLGDNLADPYLIKVIFDFPGMLARTFKSNLNSIERIIKEIYVDGGWSECELEDYNGRNAYFDYGYSPAKIAVRAIKEDDCYYLEITDIFGWYDKGTGVGYNTYILPFFSYDTDNYHFVGTSGKGELGCYYDVVADAYKDRINKATISTKFGYGGNLDRVFVAGCEALQEYEFWSEVNNPLYFPDLNYAFCGDKDTAIMGWSRIDNNQIAIHKSSNGQDPTIYVQSAIMDDEGNVNFPLTEGATGVGVVSQRAFAVLDGEPLALSSEGVFATKLVSDIPTDTKYAALRSYYINPMLKEFDLSDVEGITFDNKYYLAVGGYVFIADGNQKYLIGGNNNDEVCYEWYLWDNVPVRVWWIHNKQLYFGTSDGRICVFNDSYMDIDKPVKCYWTTPWLDFGTSAYYKKVKNVVVTVLPPDTDFSEVSVEYITAKGSKLVKSFLIDNTSHLPAVRSVATNFKQKKVPAMQIRVKADNAEHFGLVDLSVLYAVSGKFKR